MSIVKSLKKDLAKSAEADRQRSLDKIAVGKAFTDAYETHFNDNAIYVSASVDVNNFTGIECVNSRDRIRSQSDIVARLYTTVKRPKRPRINVYSDQLYKLTTDHLIKVVNSLSKSKINSELSKVLSIQERRSPTRLSR